MFLAAPGAALIRDTAKALDTELPAGFTDAIEHANRLVAAAENLGDGSPQPLSRVIVDALENERDPRSDKAVARALLDHQLSVCGAGQAARERAAHHIHTAINEFGNELLAGWSNSMQPHFDRLTAAAAQLDSLDYEPAVARGGTALTSWVAAQECIRTWGVVSDGVMQLTLAAKHPNHTGPQAAADHTRRYRRVRRDHPRHRRTREPLGCRQSRPPLVPHRIDRRTDPASRRLRPAAPSPPRCRSRTAEAFRTPSSVDMTPVAQAGFGAASPQRPGAAGIE